MFFIFAKDKIGYKDLKGYVSLPSSIDAKDKGSTKNSEEEKINDIISREIKYFINVLFYIFRNNNLTMVFDVQ